MENDLERNNRTSSKLPRIMSASLDTSLQYSASTPVISFGSATGSEKIRRTSGGASVSPPRNPISPPSQPPLEMSASLGSLSTLREEGVAYSLYERYTSEKEKCATDLEALKEKLNETVNSLETAKELTEKLSSTIVEHQQLIAKMSLQLEQEKGNISFQEEKLRVQLQSDKEENYVLLREKVEAEHLLTSAKNELSAIENRNRAFESKLATANKELANIIETTQRLGAETKMKKEIYENDLRKLTNESSELTRNINATNIEIEHLVEVQATLESKLGTVKKEMMSLATQLEKKFEQESKRNERVADSTTEEVAPPTGEVTIVFSDINDAVYLWEHLPEDVMIITVETYNKILRDKLQDLNGYEVKSEGEVFMAAFNSPINAVKWCHVVQEALLVADWPPRLLSEEKCVQQTSTDGRLLFRGVAVRMGMNSGQPELRANPLTGRADYFGPCVNKSARVSGLSQGGQVLISDQVYQEVIKDKELMKNSSLACIGRFVLRGFQELEAIYQILPRTLADRTFQSSSNEPAPSLQEVTPVRKRSIIKPKSPPKSGIVQEVSQLVKEIEDTLTAHGHTKESIEENPLTKKKNQLTARVSTMNEELAQAREIVAELKKTKQNLLKQERALKEDLAAEVENKDALDERVSDYVREKIEKDTTLEKTFKNMESIALKQREVDRQLREAKIHRHTLLKRLSEFDSSQSEARISLLRERVKEFENYLKKAEVHKELRGKYLKGLETNVENFISEIFNNHDTTAFHVANIQKIAHTAIVYSNQDRSSQTPSPMMSPSPLTVQFSSEPSSARSIPGTPEISESLLMNQTMPVTAPEYSGFPSYATRNEEFEKIQQEADVVESMRRVSELELELEQVRLEKELYCNQAQTLEAYFRKLDEAVATDDDKVSLVEISDERDGQEVSEEQKLLELKEKQKSLLHQLTVAQSEKDAVRKQLNDLRIAGSHEITRKAKALEKAKSEAAYLMQAQYFLRQVLLNQYRHLKSSSKVSAKVVPTQKEVKIDAKQDIKNVDYLNILKLQVILEENLKTTRQQSTAATPHTATNRSAASSPAPEPQPPKSKDKNQNQTVQIEVLGKLLRGETVMNEELKKVGMLREQYKAGSGVLIEIAERPKVAVKADDIKIMGRKIDANTKPSRSVNVPNGSKIFVFSNVNERSMCYRILDFDCNIYGVPASYGKWHNINRVDVREPALPVVHSKLCISFLSRKTARKLSHNRSVFSTLLMYISNSQGVKSVKYSFDSNASENNQMQSLESTTWLSLSLLRYYQNCFVEAPLQFSNGYFEKCASAQPLPKSNFVEPKAYYATTDAPIEKPEAHPYKHIIKRKRRQRPSKMTPVESDKACTWCCVNSTPEWRFGPNSVLLCNACGIQYRKEKKKEELRKKNSNKMQIKNLLN